MIEPWSSKSERKHHTISAVYRGSQSWNMTSQYRETQSHQGELHQLWQTLQSRQEKSGEIVKLKSQKRLHHPNQSRPTKPWINESLNLRCLAELQVQESKQPPEYAKAVATNIPKSRMESQPHRWPTARPAYKCWVCDSTEHFLKKCPTVPVEEKGQYKRRLLRTNPVRCQDTVVRNRSSSPYLPRQNDKETQTGMLSPVTPAEMTMYQCWSQSD